MDAFLSFLRQPCIKLEESRLKRNKGIFLSHMEVNLCNFQPQDIVGDKNVIKKVVQNPPGLFHREIINQKLLNPRVVFCCKPKDNSQGKKSDDHIALLLI